MLEERRCLEKLEVLRFYSLKGIWSFGELEDPWHSVLGKKDLLESPTVSKVQTSLALGGACEGVQAQLLVRLHVSFLVDL